MRYLACLCMLLMAVPCLAENSVAVTAFETWKGRHVDELIAAWGEPKKVKRDGEGGKVLVYRVRYYGNDIGGETEIRLVDAGVGPTALRPGGRHEDATFHEPSMTFSGGPVANGKQKIRFYVDAEGIIRREELSRRKKTRF